MKKLSFIIRVIAVVIAGYFFSSEIKAEPIKYVCLIVGLLVIGWIDGMLDASQSESEPEIDPTYNYYEDNTIRSKLVPADDLEISTPPEHDYRFEIYTRPYFWGRIGKKRWEMSVQTNDFGYGFSFSKFLIKSKN